MSLKKRFLLLSLFGISLVHSVDGQQPPPPPSLEQKAPETPMQSTPLPPETPANPALTAPPGDTEIAPLPSSDEMTTSYESAFVRMIITLLGLVFLVFATFWLLRRMGRGNLKMGAGRSINILEKRALSPKSVLYIVQIGNKKVLLSESQAEVRPLTTLEEPGEESE